MRKLIFLLLAVATLSSCSNSDYYVVERTETEFRIKAMGHAKDFVYNEMNFSEEITTSNSDFKKAYKEVIQNMVVGETRVFTSKWDTVEYIPTKNANTVIIILLICACVVIVYRILTSEFG